MELKIQQNKESDIELNISFEEENQKQEEIPRLDREARRGNWTGSQFKKLMTCSSSGSSSA